MIEIILYTGLVLVGFFGFKHLLKNKIVPYDVKIWSIIETIWLFTSFTGVSIGLYELNRIKNQFEYQEKQTEIKAEYQDLRNSIYGQTFVLRIDSSTSENLKESINWFHTIQNLLEDDYTNNKWHKFLYYTRAFVFEEKGFLNATQDNALIFKWPNNIDLKSEDLLLKGEIRLITDKLIHFENSLVEYEKLKPDNKPLFFTRHIFIFIFSIALSLKLLKTYADYIKSKK